MFTLLLSVTLLAFASAATHLLSMLYRTGLAVGSAHQSGVFSCLPGDKTLAGCSVEAVVAIANLIQKASRRGGNISFVTCLLDFAVALRPELSQHGSGQRSTPKKEPSKQATLHTSGWSFGT